MWNEMNDQGNQPSLQQRRALVSTVRQPLTLLTILRPYDSSVLCETPLDQTFILNNTYVVTYKFTAIPILPFPAVFASDFTVHFPLTVRTFGHLSKQA